MTNQGAPARIWIEEDDGCPYFYDASELAEASGPLIEYIRADLAALRSAPPVEARVTGWQPIETAPYGVPVRVKLGRGTTIVAVLRNNAAITEDGDDYAQWQAHFEGEHPECWTDGACWQSNADNVMSLQPRAWTALLPAGEGE